MNYELLYKKYSRLMCSEAYKIIGDKRLAEDAVIATFERLMKYENLEIDEHNAKGYLVTVCRNVCYNMYNNELKNIKENETNYGSIPDGVSAQKPDDIVLSREFSDRTKQIIQNLDPIYKDIFRLKIAYKKSDAEIAKMCGISEDNVRKRLSRARAKIIEALEKEGLINARK